MIDFDALQDASGLKLTTELQKKVIGAFGFLETLRMIRDRLEKLTWKDPFLHEKYATFFNQLYGLSKSDWEEQRKVARWALSWFLETELFCWKRVTHKRGRRRGPKSYYEILHMAFLALASIVAQEAGGSGPWFNWAYDPEWKDDEPQYRGSVIDFCRELLNQAGYPSKVGALAQQIKKVRKVVFQEIASLEQSEYLNMAFDRLLSRPYPSLEELEASRKKRVSH